MPTDPTPPLPPLTPVQDTEATAWEQPQEGEAPNLPADPAVRLLLAIGREAKGKDCVVVNLPDGTVLFGVRGYGLVRLPKGSIGR